MDTKDSNRNAKVLALALGASQMGFFVAAGLLGGLWLDRRWGTSPLFSLLGLLGGFASGVSLLIRLIRVDRDNKDGT